MSGSCKWIFEVVLLVELFRLTDIEMRGNQQSAVDFTSIKYYTLTNHYLTTAAASSKSCVLSSEQASLILHLHSLMTHYYWIGF